LLLRQGRVEADRHPTEINIGEFFEIQSTCHIGIALEPTASTPSTSKPEASA
jgi:hypothetical protein